MERVCFGIRNLKKCEELVKVISDIQLSVVVDDFRLRIGVKLLCFCYKKLHIEFLHILEQIPYKNFPGEAVKNRRGVIKLSSDSDVREVRITP